MDPDTVYLVSPDAVEAAVDLSYGGQQLPPGRARAVLTAAAPHIAAAALRRAAEEHRPMAGQYGADPECTTCGYLWPCFTYARLSYLAAELVPGKPDTREGILAAVGLTEEGMAERPERCYLGHPASGPNGCQGACDGP